MDFFNVFRQKIIQLSVKYMYFIIKEYSSDNFKKHKSSIIRFDTLKKIKQVNIKYPA